MEASQDSHLQSPPATAAQAATSCLQAFETQLQHAAGENPRLLSLVMDQRARFSVWASNIRAFGSGRASLDHRLREAPDVRDAIVGLLETLQYHIDNCSQSTLTLETSIVSAAPDATSFTNSLDKRTSESLRQIAAQIGLLHKFNNFIRKASRETRNPTAANKFQMLDEDGNDIETSLHAAFNHYVQDRFPDLEEAMRRRLTDSMVLQRKRMLYRRSRYGRSSIKVPTVSSQPASTGFEVEIATSVITPELQLSQADPATTPPEPSRSAIASVTQTATTLPLETFRKVSTPSTVSTSRTVATDKHEKLVFPPAPRGILRIKSEQLRRERLAFETDAELYRARDWAEAVKAIGEITCPFCFHALPVEDVVDQKRWERHVLVDLDPYVCLFNDCETPGELYSHSDAWLRHMSQHALRWRCKAKAHAPFVTASRNDYLSHMRTEHAGKFTEAQLEMLANTNGRRGASLFETCPLCGLADVEGKMEDHVIAHLRLLGLKALPTYQDAGPEAAFGSDEASQSSSNIRTRSTIIDAWQTWSQESNNSETASEPLENNFMPETVYRGESTDTANTPLNSSPPARTSGMINSKPQPMACLICQKWKLKCDGLKPSCSTCSKFGYDCVYDGLRRKEGPKKGYIKALEENLNRAETLLRKTLDSSATDIRTPGQRGSEWGLVLSACEAFASEQDDPIIQHILAHPKRSDQDDAKQQSSSIETENDKKEVVNKEAEALVHSVRKVLGDPNQQQESPNDMHLDEALDDLKKRIDDDKDYSLDNFGRLLMYGVFPLAHQLTKWDKRKDYHVYLFEDVLLCCKEVHRKKKTPNKTKISPEDPTAKEKLPWLERRGRIHMNHITDIISLTSPEPHTMQLWWYGSDQKKAECLLVKFDDEETVQEWISGLQRQRKAVSTRDQATKKGGQGASPEISAVETEDLDPSPSSSRHTAPAARSPAMADSSGRRGASASARVGLSSNQSSSSGLPRIRGYTTPDIHAGPGIPAVPGIPAHYPPQSTPRNPSSPSPDRFMALSPPQVMAMVHYEQSGIRFHIWISLEITYIDLMLKIERHETFRRLNIFRGIKLQYKDDDDDLVTIQTDDDLQMALSESRPSNTGFYEINLFITTR